MVLKYTLDSDEVITITELLNDYPNIFTNDELEKLFSIMALYPHVKILIDYSEHINDGQTFVPALRDIRNCLDHLMTYISIKLSFSDGNSIDELSKSCSNLERAAKTLLDYVSVVHKDKLDELLAEISSETQNEYSPDIHSRIYPEIFEFGTRIASLGNPCDFDEFVECIAEAKDIGNLIISVQKRLPDLSKKERENKFRSRKNHFWDVFKYVIAAIIGGTISALILYYFFKI